MTPKPIRSALASAAVLLVAGPVLAGPSGLKVVNHIAAGGDGGWDYVSVDGAARTVYVTRGGSVMSVGADTGAVRLGLASANRSHQVLPVNGGAELLITNGGNNTATIVDATTGVVRATAPTSAGPDAAILEPTTGLALVMGNKSGDINLIDPKAGVAVGVIKVGGALEYAAADGAGMVFVNVEDTGEMAAIDIKTRTVVARYKLDGCEEPSGLAYVAPSHALLAACANNVAKVVDAATGKVLTTLKIGPHPDAAFYDNVRQRAFIPCGGDGTLAVITFDGGTAKVIDTIATAKGAKTGMVDVKTGKIFLPAAKYMPPAKPGDRPAMAPGSFEILVVGD